MTRPSDEDLLAFLEGRLSADQRVSILDALDSDPALARQLRRAASGWAAMDDLRLGGEPAIAARPPRRVGLVPTWWVAAAAAAAALVSVPVTLWTANGSATPEPFIAGGVPEASAPSFVLVLQGRWPDNSTVDAAERARRAEEYWGWTSTLADRGLLVAAGDLRWEPGRQLGQLTALQVPDQEVLDDPEYVVGMITLRVDSYESAIAIAEACPHLRYGGSVSVRRVGSGFVTVPGMDDWAE